MSQQPPPQPYPGQPPAPGQRPRKQRFSAWWFMVPVALLLAGILAFVLLALTVFDDVFDTDGTIDADGRPHQVSVSGDGDRYLLTPDREGDDALTTTDMQCQIVDRESGEQIELRSLDVEYTRNDFEAVGRFDPGSGDLEVTCTSDDPTDEAQIVGVPQVGYVVLLFVLPAALVGLSLLVFLIQVIVYAIRAPRRPRTA